MPLLYAHCKLYYLVINARDELDVRIEWWPRDS